MRLVVHDEDVFHAHKIGHYALEHLPFGFHGVQFLPDASLKQLPTAFR
jgi:hypothetical protein